MIDRERRDPGLAREAEPRGRGPVGDDRDNLGRIARMSPRLDQRRHVRSAAGDQDGDPFAARHRLQPERAGQADAGAGGPLDKRPDDLRRRAGILERRRHAHGVLAGDHRHHAEAAVEGAQHFGFGDAARAGEPAEHRRRGDRIEVEPNPMPSGRMRGMLSTKPPPVMWASALKAPVAPRPRAAA
jgi:hypothetical protein